MEETFNVQQIRLTFRLEVHTGMIAPDIFKYRCLEKFPDNDVEIDHI